MSSAIQGLRSRNKSVGFGCYIESVYSFKRKNNKKTRSNTEAVPNYHISHVMIKAIQATSNQVSNV